MTQIFQNAGEANPDCDNTGVVPTGLVVPGDQGVPAGLTSTYYKTFAPRLGIAWSPGDSGKTSIRAGWGLFYNPMEQLVLEQFSAEPPFGGSNIINAPLFNTPYLQQDGTKSRIRLMGFSILHGDSRWTGRLPSHSCFTGNFSRICGLSIRLSTT